MEEIRSIEDSLKATKRKGDLVGNWVCDLRAYRSLEGMLSYRYTSALSPPKFGDCLKEPEDRCRSLSTSYVSQSLRMGWGDLTLGHLRDTCLRRS